MSKKVNLFFEYLFLEGIYFIGDGMISFFKKNKILSLLLSITIFSFIMGIFLTAFFDKQINEEITNNITNLVNQIEMGKYYSHLNLFREIKFNTIYILFLWLIGISIIGIPILICLYLVRLFTVSFEMVFLIKNIKVAGLLFSIFYMIPKFVNLIICFFLLNHSVRFSIILIKMIFFKKNYNLSLIMKRYGIVFLLSELSTLLITLIEIFLIPKLFPFII